MKYGIRITAVDPSQRIIQGVTKDGSLKQVSVTSVPVAFRWPAVGENWKVDLYNGTFYLDAPWQPTNDVFPIENMQPLEMKLNGTSIYNAIGQNLVVSTPNKQITSGQGSFSTPATAPTSFALTIPHGLNAIPTFFAIQAGTAQTSAWACAFTTTKPSDETNIYATVYNVLPGNTGFAASSTYEYSWFAVA